MSNNLFVSFRLSGPDAAEKRAAVLDVIKEHDHWALVHDELFFVSTDYEAQDLADVIAGVTGQEDQVVVIDPTSNTAYWHHVPDEVGDFMRAHWNRREDPLLIEDEVGE